MILWLLLALRSLAYATTPDAPFYVREMKDQRDVGAINENFRSLADYARQVSASADGAVSDVSEGNNIFQGDNVFSGQVHLASATFTNGIFSSSCTTNMTDTVITIPGICVAGSTITWSCPGQHVQVIYSGNASNDSNSQSTSINFLLDGAYPSPWSNSIGVVSPYTVDTGHSVTASFSPIISVPPGSHKYCLTGFSVGGALAYIPGNARTYLPTVAQFGVLCLP